MVVSGPSCEHGSCEESTSWQRAGVDWNDCPNWGTGEIDRVEMLRVGEMSGTRDLRAFGRYLARRTSCLHPDNLE